MKKNASLLWSHCPITGLLLLLFNFAVSDGRAADPAKVGPQGTSAASYLSAARRSLTEARKATLDLRGAVGHYLDAASEAMQAVSVPSEEDPKEAREIYNRASEQVAILLKSSDSLWNRTEIYDSRDGSYRLSFTPGSRSAGTWDPNYFNLLRTRKEVREKISRLREEQSDWGGVIVGVYKPLKPRESFLPSVGLAVPVTSILNFGPSYSDGIRARDVTVTLYDPTRKEKVEIEGKSRVLASDFSAPLAYYRKSVWIGLLEMIRPENYENQAGLYMVEPYDPDRIPVILVHGLMSIPEMWGPTIGAIESDPVLRGRYQFWLFGYPTGDPISLSALKLRESLARIYELYPGTKNAILISHSLGGLLSKMQVVSTGRVLWDAVLRRSADRLYAKLPPNDLVKRALIFDANPRVESVTFICVPHRGSLLALGLPGVIGTSLIHLPIRVVKTVKAVVVNSVKVALGRDSYFLPPSVHGLSPRSTLLHALDTLPIQVPYHSIIGDRGRGDTPNSSDGVVAYWSSHLTGCQSELIVPGTHGAFELPQTVSELKRILHLHLNGGGRSNRKNGSYSRGAPRTALTNSFRGAPLDRDPEGTSRNTGYGVKE